MGKLGKVKLDADGNGAMAEPFVYDASNIDKFSKIFDPFLSEGRGNTLENYHDPLLQLSRHHQGFPGVRALENVQLDLWPGKVTALIGENGAGKSTLVKVMTGIYQPEEGEILYKAIPIQPDAGVGAQGWDHRHSSGNRAVRRTLGHRKYFRRPVLYTGLLKSSTGPPCTAGAGNSHPP
jgi:hypothetical protein